MDVQHANFIFKMSDKAEIYSIDAVYLLYIRREIKESVEPTTTRRFRARFAGVVLAPKPDASVRWPGNAGCTGSTRRNRALGQGGNNANIYYLPTVSTVFEKSE